MKRKGSIVMGLAMLLVSLPAAHAQLAPTAADDLNAVLGESDQLPGFLYFDPDTGALAGPSANEPALAWLDTPEQREDLWRAAFAVLDPVGYVKQFPPLQEDLLAAQESLYRMMHPNDFAAFWDAQKTPEQLKAEQVSLFAILHPEEYNAQVLKERAARTPPPEPPLPTPAVEPAPIDPP